MSIPTHRRDDLLRIWHNNHTSHGLAPDALLRELMASAAAEAAEAAEASEYEALILEVKRRLEAGGHVVEWLGDAEAYVEDADCEDDDE